MVKRAGGRRTVCSLAPSIHCTGHMTSETAAQHRRDQTGFVKAMDFVLSQFERCPRIQIIFFSRGLNKKKL